MNSSKFKSYVSRIESSKVYDVAQITPITKANQLSGLLKNEIFLKREDLQPVFSFKVRGAYNKLALLKEKGLKGPFIAASAGNHAQGVAFGAKSLGLKAFIVMPVTTPSIKVNSVKNYGGRVILHGDNFDEAFKYAIDLAKKESYTFIHPYDDKDVIAGQGTVGKELIEQIQSGIDAVFVPVGGGGLLAGVGTYIKSVSPETKVIGVEPEDAACLKLALDNNKRLMLKEVGLFADGVAVKQVGKETFSLIKEWVDDVVTVSVDEMCASVQDTFQETRTIAEPAGALALAGLKKYCKSRGLKNKTLVAINSGANLNFDRLGHIVERVQLGESKEVLLSVKIPEEKGSFRKFCKLLGKRMISEFQRWGYGNQRKLIGCFQLIGGAGLIYGSLFVTITFDSNLIVNSNNIVAGSSLILTIMMIGAIFVRIDIKDKFINILPATFYAILNFMIFYNVFIK